MRILRMGLVCLLAVASRLGHTQTELATNVPVGTALSTRVVDYTIDAHVDMAARTLDATETLAYRNLTGQPLTVFPFHLYLNAFEPQSTFTSETHFGGGIRDSESADEYPDRKLGSIAVSQLTADGFGDLTAGLHPTAPDDGNANDRTVAEVILPHPVAPGEQVVFHLKFHDKFPESVARNGYKRDFLMGGQWYPKLGVFWQGRWNCHQYHATTEFFSDFGTFKVRLTVPRQEVVGASGVPTGDVPNPDGTRTVSFYGEDIHDFAFALSPHFDVLTATYLSAMGPVQVRVLALKAHPAAGARYLKVLLGSLREFEARYGPYPYKVLTLVDPEPDSQIGGMEYPTLVTGDASLLDPTKLLEITAEHEFGHQYWYGMVASNEFEEAWLDEGINSYTETKVMAALEGKDTSALGLGWINASDAELQYLQYAGAADDDPVTRAAWKFRNASSYGGVTYGKSATLLRTLDGLLGEQVMDDAMRTYFLRYRFTHPTTRDFLNTIAEVAIRHGCATPVYGQSSGNGRPQVLAVADPLALAGSLPVFTPPAQPQVIIGSSLTPYFDQAVYGTRVLDYAVESIQSGPAEWWKPKPDSKLVRSTVTVHRVGDFVLPVTVEVRFEDGSVRRERWAPAPDENGRENDRWVRYTYVGRQGEVVSAEVDPDHQLALDLDRFNNSRTRKANGVPAGKIAGVMLVLNQMAEQLMGWVV